MSKYLTAHFLKSWCVSHETSFIFRSTFVHVPDGFDPNSLQYIPKDLLLIISYLTLPRSSSSCVPFLVNLFLHYLHLSVSLSPCSVSLPGPLLHWWRKPPHPLSRRPSVDYNFLLIVRQSNCSLSFGVRIEQFKR